MNIRMNLSILAFTLLAGGGLLIQSCTTPLLKPKAAAKLAPCDLGLAYAGELVLGVFDAGEVSGTTSGRANMVSTACGGAGIHPDAVYKIVVEETLALSVTICPVEAACPSVAFWEGCPGESEPLDEACTDGCLTYGNPFIPAGTYYMAIEAHPECAPPNTFSFTLGYGTYPPI